VSPRRGETDRPSGIDPRASRHLARPGAGVQPCEGMGAASARRRIRRAVSASWCVALLGCGAGGPSSTSPASTAPAGSGVDVLRSATLRSGSCRRSDQPDRPEQREGGRDDGHRIGSPADAGDGRRPVGDGDGGACRAADRSPRPTRSSGRSGTSASRPTASRSSTAACGSPPSPAPSSIGSIRRPARSADRVPSRTRDRSVRTSCSSPSWTLWLPLFDGTEVVQVSTGAVSVSGARVPVIDSVSRPRSPAPP
jgi:hypothetical protein